MVDDNIIDFLLKLGVSSEGARVYIALMGKSAQTAQKIATNSRIPKTTVYRRLEELKTLGLIEERVGEHKRIFTTTSIDLLNLLIIRKEQEIKELRAQLPSMEHLLLGQFQSLDPETKVLFYRGREGIQQMLWNILKVKTELLGYTYRDLIPLVGKSFWENWTKEFTAIRCKARDLYSDEYLRSKSDSKNPKENIWGKWDSRYIDPKILDIQHQMDVYNNVVCIYNWHGSDVFGVEIYNSKVAKLQRQLFEVMWQRGKVLNSLKQVVTKS